MSAIFGENKALFMWKEGVGGRVFYSVVSYDTKNPDFRLQHVRVISTGVGFRHEKYSTNCIYSY